MKKKIAIVLLTLMLGLSGCKKAKETVGNETSKDDVIENSFSDDYYNIVSSKGSPIRERFYSNLANNQDDYKTVGRGLQLLSLDYFSNDTHYMKEGSYITTKDYQELTLRGSNYPYSLQIPEGTTIDGVETSHGGDEDATKIKTPVMFQTLYQQEYMKKNGDNFELAGISMAIVISAEYTANLNGTKALSPTHFSQEVIEQYSKAAIETTYRYFKDTYSELTNIPMLISVYQMANSTDVTSGSYIYSSYCDGGVGEIKSVNQETVIFTSDSAKEVDAATYNEFVLIKEKTKNFATEAIGMVGAAKYQDNKIQSMVIELNLNTKTFSEEIAIMNYMASLINTGFTSDFFIKVNVKAQDSESGTIIKEVGQEAKSYLDY